MKDLILALLKDMLYSTCLITDSFKNLRFCSNMESRCCIHFLNDDLTVGVIKKITGRHNNIPESIMRFNPQWNNECSILNHNTLTLSLEVAPLLISPSGKASHAIVILSSLLVFGVDS